MQWDYQKASSCMWPKHLSHHFNTESLRVPIHRISLHAKRNDYVVNSNFIEIIPAFCVNLLLNSYVAVSLCWFKWEDN